MKAINTQPDGGPAFPSIFQDHRGDVARDAGMSLRDWFAGQALAGILSAEYEGDFSSVYNHSSNNEIAASCYGLADAMLSARKQQ